MFSITPAEFLTIGIVALIVFGPRRLPEIARKIGKVAREARRAADDFRAGIEQEYQEGVAPLTQAGESVRTAMEDIASDVEAKLDTPDNPEAPQPDPTE